LTHIFEIKNNLGIDTSSLPKIVGFKIQKHDDLHILWAQALAIYSFSNQAFSPKTSNCIPGLPRLSGTPVVNVSTYF
jgi:hypothetical protein